MSSKVAHGELGLIMDMMLSSSGVLLLLMDDVRRCGGDGLGEGGVG